MKVGMKQGMRQRQFTLRDTFTQQKVVFIIDEYRVSPQHRHKKLRVAYVPDAKLNQVMFSPRAKSFRGLHEWLGRYFNEAQDS